MTRTVSFRYTCRNDCIQTGCPGHELELSLSTVSDVVSLDVLGHKDKNGEWVNTYNRACFDINELNALIRAWEELKVKG